jgi:Flp pilus assembly protein TadB
MRQAQHKAELLEQEIANERAQIDAERQNLIKLQNSVREQAQLRYKSLNDQFRSRWFTTLTFLMTLVLLALSLLQFTLNALGLPIYILLFLPMVICVVLAYFLARSRVYTRFQEASKQPGHKATIKLPNPKMADKPALKTSAKKS